MSYEIHAGDAYTFLRSLAPRSVDHVISDPPYSARTHAGVRGHGRQSLAGGNGKPTIRTIDLGFAHLEPRDIGALCHEFARVARRWVLVFADLDLVPLWRAKGARAGLRYVQTPIWDRVGGAPQFDGLGPATPCEFIIAFHVRGSGERRRWNGGGKRGIYSHPIVANRLGQQGSRIHTAQKPVGLMQDLVIDFTDVGETILDPFMGSGTTGVAAVRYGRRFIGNEGNPTIAELGGVRLEAESKLSTLSAVRMRQAALFDKVPAPKAAT